MEKNTKKSEKLIIVEIQESEAGKEIGCFLSPALLDDKVLSNVKKLFNEMMKHSDEFKAMIYAAMLEELLDDETPPEQIGFFLEELKQGFSEKAKKGHLSMPFFIGDPNKPKN